MAKINETIKGSYKNKDKLNVVYIVLDDSGFSDFGCFGSEIETPNLNWLAENGLRFTNYHSPPTCSPTRSSLLTGRNHHAVGMATVANFDFGPEFPNKRGRIVPEAATIAEVLKGNGYNNYALGKWHLSPSHQATPAGPYDNWPLGKGFDRFYGFLEDSTDQYKPEMVNDNTFVEDNEEGYHVSEAIVNKANQYITDHVSIDPNRPFFLTLNFGAQHQPVQVFKEYIDLYSGKYDVGWDVIRKQRFEKQKELGIIPENAEFIARNPGVKAWDELSSEEQKVFARFKEVYAGFLTHTDEQIGKLLDHLRAVDELDKTIVVVISDDGASSRGSTNGSVNHTLSYNGIDQDFDYILEDYDDMGSEKSKIEFPNGWAQVSNTPFKFYKATTFEGGLRNPLIIYHPTKIEEKGGIRNQYLHVSDITPTIYDLLDVKMPEEVKGVKQMPLHGQSFLQAFHNPEARGREIQYYEHNGMRAIYYKGWKAIGIRRPGQPFENDPWQLYHAEVDCTENHNLAETNKEKLVELQKIWEVEAEKYNVFPMSDAGPDGFSKIADDTLRARNYFVLYPGMSHLPEGAAPFIINRSYSIRVPIERKSGAEEGVLVALGGSESGYTLYIKNNRLVYEYNIGTMLYRVESREDVPKGEITVELYFKRTGNYKGVASLYIDDCKVGEGAIEQTHPYKLSFEGLDIGKDSRYPVSPVYRNLGEFSFTGIIKKVIYDIVAEK
ncbi:arylsulfatase [Evansella vedderi]|uniref:Arylsulfatase n=1 Tax=Evansella vedderi TaxID=38282 RepID=A0ABU0A1L5_9BACI|nr:arylsulfatase [Evansella vedderi]MDQ0257120.1 arylsulfatase [Evansella vedderi]